MNERKYVNMDPKYLNILPSRAGQRKPGNRPKVPRLEAQLKRLHVPETDNPARGDGIRPIPNLCEGELAKE